MPAAKTERNDVKQPDERARDPSQPYDVTVRQGARPGDRVVRIVPTYRGRFTRKAGRLVATEQASTGEGVLWNRIRRVLIGRPIPTEREIHERVGVFKGLAVFASDNISSSAYATEEIMRVLALAGAGALTLTMPITIAVVGVLAIVVASYQQTLRAYPSGGGSYIVASDNLGPAAGLVAAAALLTDYVLTVAVSVAAGVAAITSIAPELFDLRVVIGVAFVALICLGNLRGIRESATIFATPTYVYLAAIFGLLGYGLFRALENGDGEEIRRWLLFGAAADAGDLLGTLGSWRRLPRVQRTMIAAGIVGFGAFAVWLAGQF